MERKYPSRNGIIISPMELELPESRLNLEKDKNWNNHHGEFIARKFGQNVLYLTVRDIETVQFAMPIDVHDYLHQKYTEPVFPTPKQAMEFIEESKYYGDKLNRKRKGHHYTKSDISDELYYDCLKCYEKIK